MSKPLYASQNLPIFTLSHSSPNITRTVFDVSFHSISCLSLLIHSHLLLIVFLVFLMLTISANTDAFVPIVNVNEFIYFILFRSIANANLLYIDFHHSQSGLSVFRFDFSKVFYSVRLGSFRDFQFGLGVLKVFFSGWF